MTLFNFCATKFSFAPTRAASFLSRQTVQLMKETLNPPKRAGSGYSLFYAEKYPLFREKFPDLGVIPAAQRLANDWRGLAENEKKYYMDRAHQLKVQQQANQKAFLDSLTDRQRVALELLRLNRRAQTGRFSRRSLTPQQRQFLESLPPTAYANGRSLFLSGKMKGSAGSGDAQNNRFVEAAKEWKALSESQRATYEKQAEADVKRYRTDLEKFLGQ